MLPTVIRAIRTRSSGNGASQRGRRFRRLLMGGAAAIGSIGGTALLAQPASAAATLTISPTGSDTGNCVGSPCLTLGYALTQAAASDTITVDAGTYDVSASTTVPASLAGTRETPRSSSRPAVRG